MPHASPTTTTMIALPVSFGLSSTVLNRKSAPMPKMTKASVWLVPLSSATTAPTTPRSMSALRSSKSLSGSRSDARRGCHAIAKAQPTAKLRLRKSRRMNEGWANCSTLFSIDSHEFPLGSIPPPAPALAISSAGLAPNAAEDKHAYKGNDSDDRDCAQRPPEMAIRGASNKNYVRRVHFSLELSFLASRKPTPFCANASYLQHATARLTDPTR